ncbi:MAG: type II toxin-antitoxin system CcdA family antitoxin, partial [Paraburkholderia sp.]|nr:type II toxin-antitoxin system CcdA family antitoxin [Paraburkholderia sp.]
MRRACSKYSRSLYERAKSLGINFSRTCEQALREAIRAEEGRRWAKEHADTHRVPHTLRATSARIGDSTFASKEHSWNASSSRPSSLSLLWRPCPRSLKRHRAFR